MGYLILFIAVAIVFGVVGARRAGGGKAVNARLRGFGVVVDGGQVKAGGRVLGPLAGARAEVTDGTSRHTLTRVVTVAGAFTKKTTAAVVVSFPGGAVHARKIQGAPEIRRAQTWVIKFNAMAAAPSAAAAPSPAVPADPELPPRAPGRHAAG